MNNRLRLDFIKLEKALNSLKIVVNKIPDQDRTIIDASIQRFEFTFELFWKLLKRILQIFGQELYYPKQILTEAYVGNLIENEQAWLQMLADRNETSQTCDEKIADRIYRNIKIHYPIMQTNFDKLKQQFATSLSE